MIHGQCSRSIQWIENQSSDEENGMSTPASTHSSSKMVDCFTATVRMIRTTEDSHSSMVTFTHNTSFSYSSFICVVILCALLFSGSISNK
jgi:hypothetical protein